MGREVHSWFLEAIEHASKEKAGTGGWEGNTLAGTAQLIGNRCQKAGQDEARQERKDARQAEKNWTKRKDASSVKRELHEGLLHSRDQLSKYPDLWPKLLKSK